DGAPARASNGMRIDADASIRSRRAAQVVFVPGFGYAGVRAVPAIVSALERARPLARWLRARHEGGAEIVAACTGVFLLAESGLLAGGAATTTWWLGDLFRARYPAVDLDLDAMLVRRGRVVCAGAAMSYLDLLLHVIESHAGADLARRVARALVLDNRRPSQAPYRVPAHVRAEDPLVDGAARWMEAHLAEDFRVEDLAKALGASSRTLLRRFRAALATTPLAHLQIRRVERAKALLETTSLGVDEIGARVGYEDPSAFGRLFKRATSMSPGAYRKRFGVTAKDWIRSR
ncbi:MAG: helix-turn-helix domain-containing protein, partial [Myxococcales bacterium]|nr:helix-turn-helix domain-containing protein [Myxococcales bacterium]